MTTRPNTPRQKGGFFWWPKKFYDMVKTKGNSPLSNFIERIGAWSGIITGVAALLISIVQLIDHETVDNLKLIVGSLNDQMAAITKVNNTLLDQNKSMVKEYNVMVDEYKTLTEQEKKIGILLELQMNEAKTKELANNLEFGRAVGEMFWYIDGSLLWLGSLDVKNLTLAKNGHDWDGFQRKIDLMKRTISDYDLNTILVKSPIATKVWKDFELSVIGLDAQAPFMLNGTKVWPLASMTSENRKAYLGKFKRSCLQFVNTFQKYSIGYPALKFLIEQLSEK